MKYFIFLSVLLVRL